MDGVVFAGCQGSNIRTIHVTVEDFVLRRPDFESSVAAPCRNGSFHIAIDKAAGGIYRVLRLTICERTLRILILIERR